jgi:hypothetical protein
MKSPATAELHITGAAVIGTATIAGVTRQGHRHPAVIGGKAGESRKHPLCRLFTVGAGGCLRRLAHRADELELVVTIGANVLVYRHFISPLPV